MRSRRREILDFLIIALLTLVVFCLVALISGCAHQTMTLPSYSGPSPNIQFKYDLHGTINGYPFEGVGVVPVADQYEVKVESNVDVDLMTITTCHRDWSDQDQPIETGGWFKPNRGFTFTFSPVHGIEDYGTCLLRIGAYNKNGDPQAWATIDFITPDANLPSTNKCDGSVGKTHGSSMCQSKAGLDEEIDFDVPVMMSDKTRPECQMRGSPDGKVWEYTLPNSECVDYFVEIAPPHRWHRHTFFGYKSIQLRGK
jgi:hypothetical protein